MPPFVKTASFIKRWLLIFLDEAQVMKNAQTKIAQSLRQFVVPAVLLCQVRLSKPFRRVVVYLSNCPSSSYQVKKEFMKLPADRVAQFIKPFVMRRKKEEVLTELPDLIEVVYKK